MINLNKKPRWPPINKVQKFIVSHEGYEFLLKNLKRIKTQTISGVFKV